MTQDELRAAVLAALIDYDTLKKTRRIKAVKKALHGTVMATVIGSTSINAADSERNQPIQNTSTPNAALVQVKSENLRASDEKVHRQTIVGVAHFGLNHFTLAAAHKDRLMDLVRQLPEGAELTVIGSTDASGGHAHNMKLGKHRARSVAQFLSAQGVKIHAIDSQISNAKHSGWMARSVDIVVSYSAAQAVAINLPQLAKPNFVRSHKNLHHLESQVTANHQNGIVNPIKSNLYQAHRIQQIIPIKKLESTPVEPSVPNQWWDEKSKVNDAHLEKVSWAETNQSH
jgi:outer membrane protein OmpA-like peptidoglycan-associated protein